jgi:hypothetical protein
VQPQQGQPRQQPRQLQPQHTLPESVRCSGRRSRLGSNPHNRGKNSSPDRYGHSALRRNNGKW